MVMVMSKRRKEDPLVTEIQHELMPGRFVRYDEVCRFTDNLDRVHERLEALVKAGEAERAVRFYEIFLSGVYAKIEECDDECYLPMTFTSAFCGWIKTRQAAGRPAEETMSQVLKWMENDNYGFCHNIEQDVIKALDREGQRLFIGHFQGLIEKAMPSDAKLGRRAGQGDFRIRKRFAVAGDRAQANLRVVKRRPILCGLVLQAGFKSTRLRTSDGNGNSQKALDQCAGMGRKRSRT